MLAWAPEIARFDPGSPGGLLDYDFHLGAARPLLIEINTNPGGALLNVLLARAQQACCGHATGLVVAPTGAQSSTEEALLEVLLVEWRAQRGDVPPKSVAIVDETPEQQYLRPEFLLFQRLFERHGIDAVICDLCDLDRRDGRFWHHGRPSISFTTG